MQSIKHYRFQSGKFAIETSSEELRQIAIAWLMISFIFAMLDARGILSILTYEFIVLFLVAAFTVGIGFLFHELAHKVVAQHYRCWAEFRADFQMLLIAVAMSLLFGFVFIAPGAVYIQGHVTRKQNGIISIAGPLMNFLLAIIFLALFFFFSPEGITAKILSQGFMINTWLGLFNMIPFGFFDGAKVFAWNKAVYFSFVAVMVILLFGVPYI